MAEYRLKKKIKTGTKQVSDGVTRSFKQRYEYGPRFSVNIHTLYTTKIEVLISPTIYSNGNYQHRV